jgi:hypothetical protein
MLVGCRVIMQSIEEISLALTFSLPRNLWEATPEQMEQSVLVLSKKSTNQLRKEQSIITSQIKMAFDNKSLDSDVRERAIRNLQIMHDWRSAAVGKREFPQ